MSSNQFSVCPHIVFEIFWKKHFFSLTLNHQSWIKKKTWYWAEIYDKNFKQSCSYASIFIARCVGSGNLFLVFTSFGLQSLDANFDMDKMTQKRNLPSKSDCHTFNSLASKNVQLWRWFIKSDLMAWYI